MGKGWNVNYNKKMKKRKAFIGWNDGNDKINPLASSGFAIKNNIAFFILLLYSK